MIKIKLCSPLSVHALTVLHKMGVCVGPMGSITLLTSWVYLPMRVPRPAARITISMLCGALCLGG